MLATTSTIAAHTSKRSTGLIRRVHRLVLSLTVSIALIATMHTVISVHADALVSSASRVGYGGSTADTASLLSGSGWYAVVGDGGKVYSPEAEAANPELADRWMGLASTEKEVSSPGWYVITDEGGRAYSPEAEAFNPELAGLP